MERVIREFSPSEILFEQNVVDVVDLVVVAIVFFGHFFGLFVCRQNLKMQVASATVSRTRLKVDFGQNVLIKIASSWVDFATYLPWQVGVHHGCKSGLGSCKPPLETFKWMRLVFVL